MINTILDELMEDKNIKIEVLDENQKWIKVNLDYFENKDKEE